ncbi:MAG: metallophosphoesterase [Oscillospiraceae bacterium]|nr:metallophosphoesterase [Oscillospiraceae bacterium]
MQESESVKKKNRYIILKLIAAAAAVFAVLGAASFPFKTVYYEVSAEGIGESVRIVQISDLHSERYGKNMQNLIKAIDSTSPDIIVLTGDIYDDVLPKDNTTALLSDIGCRYPCFYVAGNHEFRTPKWVEFKAEAEALGVHVLEGDNVNINGITICGAARAADNSIGWADSVAKCADDLNSAPSSDDPLDTEQTRDNTGNSSDFTVLLCHFSEDIDFYRSFGKFDLILCGHAHGGQWRLPFSQNGLYSPGEGIFPKYSGGRFDFDDSCMIVSRGLCRTKTLFPRIFNNPELVVIDLVNN